MQSEERGIPGIEDRRNPWESPDIQRSASGVLWLARVSKYIFIVVGAAFLLGNLADIIFGNERFRWETILEIVLLSLVIPAYIWFVSKWGEKLIYELQNALREIRMLEGLLPICASCKKVRDDKGYWNQIESYVQERSSATFSHSICPQCMKTMYPQFDKLKTTEEERPLDSMKG